MRANELLVGLTAADASEDAFEETHSHDIIYWMHWHFSQRYTARTTFTIALRIDCVVAL